MGTMAAPSHLQSYPFTPPVWSQLVVRELCSQGSSAAPLIPLQKAALCPGHTVTASLCPLCLTAAQLMAQQLVFRTDPDRMADWRQANTPS